MRTAANLLFLIIYLIFLFVYSAQNHNAVMANPLAAFGLVILGAWLSALLAKRARIIVPRYYSIIYQSLLGGFLMGLGFTLAGLPQLANTLAMVHGVFYWLSLLMPAGFLYVGCVFLGGWAAMFLQRVFYPKVSFTVLPVHIQKNIHKRVKLCYLALGLLVLFVSVQLVLLDSSPWPGLAGITLALLSGFLLERNRFCMGLMMKEIYFTKTINTLLKLIGASLVLGFTLWSLGVDIGRDMDIGVYGNNMHISNYLAVLAGSFLMGFGFVLADGCYMGSLWKAGQGNIASLITVIGIFLGAGLSSAVHGANITIGHFTTTAIDTNWPIMAVRVGLAVFILIWVGTYLMEQPEQIIKTGTKSVWIFSEAAIIGTLATIFLGPKVAMPSPLLVLGFILYFAGIALYIWARVNLGKYWGESIVLRAGHKIVRQGPYKYVKHPIYLAITLSLTGMSLLLRTPWGLAGVYLLTLPLLISRAKEEERILMEVPGASDYFKET